MPRASSAASSSPNRGWKGCAGSPRITYAIDMLHEKGARGWRVAGGGDIRFLRFAASAAPTSGGEQRLHLLEGVGLDLADALGADAVFVGQLLQRHLVVVVEPAAADDVARTRIQRLQAFAQQFQLVVLVVGALVGLGRIVFLRHQVGGRRRRGALVVLVGGQVETD